MSHQNLYKWTGESEQRQKKKKKIYLAGTRGAEVLLLWRVSQNVLLVIPHLDKTTRN